MSATRFEPSSIKNKLKREEVSRKHKKAKGQDKLQKRLARAKLEANDPIAKKKRLAENVPRTLDNAREFDPSMLTANPAASGTSDPSSSSTGAQPTAESALDIASDPFASYFSFSADPTVPPKVLITTSMKASRATYDFCDELVGVIPGAEFIRRKKGKGFEVGRISGWAAGRGYGGLIVVNEDMKKPNAITFVHLPEGPSAYFKLSSIQLTRQISGHARATAHNPELVLNNFMTRLGHAVGRMFQTLFPPMPEFQGRQVVTLHNQRDFLFFRRHRYAFRSTEKAALQEIGPRFTLKLRWLKKGIPAVHDLGQPAMPLEFAEFVADDSKGVQNRLQHPNDEEKVVDNMDEVELNPSAELRYEEGNLESEKSSKKVEPPIQDEYLWMWKPELETSRSTFFL